MSPSAYVTGPSPHAGRPGAAAYGNRVTSAGSSKALAVAVYTVLRVLLFAAVWLTIELLTPISGLLAIIAALLVSGAISLLVLDRQRGRAASVAAGFFGRINERIEASARAEDDDDDASRSDQREQGTEDESVDKQ